MGVAIAFCMGVAMAFCMGVAVVFCMGVAVALHAVCRGFLLHDIFRGFAWELLWLCMGGAVALLEEPWRTPTGTQQLREQQPCGDVLLLLCAWKGCRGSARVSRDAADARATAMGQHAFTAVWVERGEGRHEGQPGRSSCTLDLACAQGSKRGRS
eukprot:365252-Chlamydomonas_euryale.AAC.49